MYRHVVFNANASDARHVNSRFNRDHVSGNQNMSLSTRHTGLLMHFQAKPMSGAVHKIFVKPVVRQNPSGGGIDIPTRDAGLRRGDRSRLRLLDRPIPSPYARRRASDEYSPRNIAAIVAEYNTQVQYHQFVFSQPFFRRPRMRMCGARSDRRPTNAGPSASAQIAKLLDADLRSIKPYFSAPAAMQPFAHAGRQ